MSKPPIPSPETLLSQRQFLRPIVRALMRGEDGVDDVEQETVVRAWLASKAEPRSWAWLRRIARNLGIDRLRAARREAQRRASLPPPEPAPSADEVLQHEEQRRRVVQAVLALPQPYRNVVLLRFWEELSPAAIAARLGVPGATVRSQLARGLAMLKERLDAGYGERRAWLVALAPFAGPAGASVVLWGVLLMTKTKVAALAAVVLAVCVGALWWGNDPLPAPAGVGDARVYGAPSAAAANLDAVPLAGVPAVADVVPPRVDSDPATLVVQGEVRNGGKPFPGLALELQWFAGFAATGTPETSFAIVVDGDGNFRWQGARRLEPGVVQVVTTRPEVKLWCTPELVLPEQALAKLPCTVQVLDRILFGRVLDRRNAPIEGAALSINGWAETKAISNADGRYEMRVPAPGYPLLVHAKNHADRLIEGFLPADVPRHEFDVVLDDGGTIAGVVVDDAGQPMAGASVRASGFGPPVDTAADGRFVVGGLALADDHEIVATKTGWQRASTTARAGANDVRLVLTPGRTIQLRVVDQETKPLVGATVHLVLNTYTGWQRVGYTVADGRLALADLPDHDVEVVVQRPGHVTVRRPIPASDSAQEVVVQLARGYAIAGQVVDGAGKPVARASIYCERREAPMASRSVGSRSTTDADGRFEVEGLPPEACTLYAHHADYRRAEFAFIGGTVPQTTVQMQPAPSFTGRVVDGATGAPLAAFIVAVQPSREPLVFGIDPEAFQAADGRFRLRHWRLPTGVPVTVMVTANGFAGATFTTEAQAAPPDDQNVVRLFAGVRVEGVVRDPANDQPVAGVTVELMTPASGFRPNEGPVTDASGSFAIADVAVGEHRLRLQHAERPEAVFGPFLVGPGPGVMQVKPTMGSGVALRGRVTGPADVAGLEVHAYRDDGKSVETKVRADATFELRGLGAGPTRLTISEGTSRMRTLRVVVGDRDVDGVVFALRSGAGAVRITVDGAASGTVSVRRLDAAALEDTSDMVRFVDGAALVDGLAPGRYRVSASAAEAQLRGVVIVDVPAGEVAVRVECRSPR
ncbi:MAG: sigma-70 family RNA polymerase sigma factor [Planctomycetes bacterium]|nr:sigma-70 family RNA polymerase sigma factor [Planctomycetota bacterium]